ncbi:MAG: putative rane protein [Edaphobacter sp.]|nr:putative rane protein [Edaphobacter sp.]
MPVLQHICQTINETHLSVALRESVWVFPIIETVHVIGITLLVGTIAILDLRLLGLVFRRERVSLIARQVLPVTWTGFAIVMISGVFLFIAEAAQSYTNPAFRWKLLLLLLVGINPLVFHTTVYRKVALWDETLAIPFRARLAGAISLTLWCGIVVAGRAIAYYN